LWRKKNYVCGQKRLWVKTDEFAWLIDAKKCLADPPGGGDSLFEFFANHFHQFVTLVRLVDLPIEYLFVVTEPDHGIFFKPVYGSDDFIVARPL
jgi:hypothetical protein